MTTADGIAIGGGALTVSLIDFLVGKGIITQSDARTIITRANAQLAILDPGDRAAATEVITVLSQQIATRK
jgi:hypothetical protein